ncbi:hypothetical protein [Pontibacillus litoralis]|uniref:CNNM transmembrane domain-containing protein n=1 Tax=Pontibacillus litoralis JSM 072002 TaxID=1385512 RepID=A0A0A5G6D3_9BACI|nr:hypothetical protein [Pontibacillus litoralis]KGX87584.1 hypothetical protein N784_15160 [Pontibacillus litoralis JSM 072002]
MLKQLRQSMHWSSKISLLTFTLALFFSTLSTLFREGSTLFLSLLIVFLFILIGVIADTVGLAAATAKEHHFHAMASKKVRGAKEAAYISKNAPLFSSFFNDVIGDIAGIVSGAASTAVVFQMTAILNTSEGSILFIVITVLLTSVIAALTVGGKALCKTIAIYQSTNIVLYTGKCLYILKAIKSVIFIPNVHKKDKWKSPSIKTK